MRFVPRNKKALVVSVIFHLVLLIIFLFVGLTQPDPLPEEIGVEIAMADLGNSTTGQGDNPSPKVTDNPTPVQNQQVATPTQPSTAQPKVAQQDDSEIATPSSKTDAKKEVKPTENPPKPVEEEKPKRTVNREALYPGNKNTNTSSAEGGSQGDRSGRGDMGSEEGKDQGKGVIGGGMGSWELSGRSLLRGTVIEDTKEEGTVVLNIWVDQYGNVTRSTPNLAESTTTSQYLFDLAMRAAKQSKYSAKSNAAVEQKGKMTFKFILE